MKEKNRVFHCIGLTNWTVWDIADRVASIRGTIYSNKKNAKLESFSKFLGQWMNVGEQKNKQDGTRVFFRI